MFRLQQSSYLGSATVRVELVVANAKSQYTLIDTESWCVKLEALTFKKCHYQQKKLEEILKIFRTVLTLLKCHQKNMS